MNSIGFKSPKAKIFQHKVQDLHKYSDTFNAARKAIFSGLFHINGNLNYSVIELFEDNMLSTMEKKIRNFMTIKTKKNGIGMGLEGDWKGIGMGLD